MSHNHESSQMFHKTYLKMVLNQETLSTQLEGSRRRATLTLKTCLQLTDERQLGTAPVHCPLVQLVGIVIHFDTLSWRDIRLVVHPVTSNGVWLFVITPAPFVALCILLRESYDKAKCPVSSPGICFTNVLMII